MSQRQKLTILMDFFFIENKNNINKSDNLQGNVSIDTRRILKLMNAIMLLLF